MRSDEKMGNLRNKVVASAYSARALWTVAGLRGSRRRFFLILAVTALAFLINNPDIIYQAIPYRTDTLKLRQEELPIFDEMMTPLFLKLKENEGDINPQVSTIGFGTEKFRYLQDNPCKGRKAMTDLVKALDLLGVRVIVIDKYYSPYACDGGSVDDKGSVDADLEAALTRSHAHIVVGVHTDAEIVGKDWALCVAPSLAFNNAPVATNESDWEKPPAIVKGILRINQNLNRIPIQWPILDPRSCESKVRSSPESFEETVEFAAARIANPNLIEQPGGLKSFLANGFSPYGESAHLTLKDAAESDVLCSQDPKLADLKLVAKWGPDCSTAREFIPANVVVIGSPTETDRYILNGEAKYGYQIVGMYIEEMLSARYLHEIPPFFSYTFLIAWGVASNAFLVFAEPPWKILRTITWVTLAIILALVILLVLDDIFPPMTLISCLILSVALMWLIELAEKLKNEREKTLSHRSA